MRYGILFAAACLASAAGPDEATGRILARVSEEAQVFRSLAPRMLAQETLVQRALKPPRRFRPRIGAAAVQPTKPEYRSREIVSEYGFSSLASSPNALHEFRQVVTVDGRRLATAEKARDTLATGMRSDDDRLKKRMLEQFEKLGLIGAASDFGQLILLFSRHRLSDYSFRAAGQGRIGADTATILEFEQRAGAASLLIFEGRKAIHNPLTGQLWVRQSDALPLRIVLRSLTKDGDRVQRHEATVDYTMTPHGVIAPVSVVHRQYVGQSLTAENVFRYSPFRMFKADAEVKFGGLPEKQ